MSIVNLDLYQLLFDASTLTLIWLVQLVIYPSFSFYAVTDLKKWHNTYTRRVSYVVLPLMLGQLILSGIQIYNSQNAYTISHLTLVIVIWLITFLVFVPLHTRISTSSSVNNDVSKLVRYNWCRTLIWTIIFLISFLQFILN